MFEENLFIPYANNKGADQPAHPRSLISIFIVRCLASIIPVITMYKISRLKLASVAEQAGLSLTWSQTPKTGFLVTWLKLFDARSQQIYASCDGLYNFKFQKW